MRTIESRNEEGRIPVLDKCSRSFDTAFNLADEMTPEWRRMGLQVFYLLDSRRFATVTAVDSQRLSHAYDELINKTDG
jgi:hypothetical protein